MANFTHEEKSMFGKLFAGYFGGASVGAAAGGGIVYALAKKGTNPRFTMKNAKIDFIFSGVYLAVAAGSGVYAWIQNKKAEKEIEE